MAPVRNLTIYEAWQSTLAPFLVPACVLSTWPIFVIVCTSNRTPLKMLCMLALVSLADGFLGSCAFPLMHQYAFTPSQNNRLFYAGSICYWLSGLVLGPVLEVWGTRKSSLVLGLAGLLGAVGSAQDIFVLTVVGRCCSATATAGLTTLVEHVLYDEAHIRRSIPGERDEHQHEKEHMNGSTHEEAEGLGGSMLTMYHQLRPLTLWASMLLGPYTMAATPEISTGPCWAAAVCYVVVLLMAWRLLPPRTAGRSLKLTGRLMEMSSKSTMAERERYLPGLMSAKPGPSSSSSALFSATNSAGVQRWLWYYVSSYVISIKTLVHPQHLARHLVDILFGGLFFVLSLLWVPTLEMYDDSIPFGFIFQIFMIALFLGSTFSLPVWAVGCAEIALVALLSVTARFLNTSRDYAIPVTIMLAGVAMHVVAGATQTTGTLWRAEYPSAAAPLTFLFVVKALTGMSGWVFLHVIDGKYMEDVFVLEARWMYGLMWIEAIAAAQYIAKRAAQHREARSSNQAGLHEDSNAIIDTTTAVSVDADLPVLHHPHVFSTGSIGRSFKP